MTKDSLHILGKISKTHGYAGVMRLLSDSPLSEAVETLGEVFVEVDGLLVPFAVEDCTLCSDCAAQLKLEFTDSQEEAARLVGSAVYAAMDIEPEEDEIPSWEGFSVNDATHGAIGVISQIEDFNGNIVLQVIQGERELLLPLHPELIEKIDEQRKTLYIRVPEGLIE